MSVHQQISYRNKLLHHIITTSVYEQIVKINIKENIFFETYQMGGRVHKEAITNNS